MIRKILIGLCSPAVLWKVAEILQSSADAVRTILSDGVLKAMTKYNGE